MKNFYETLEVSENASQEIIEKAYKVLAKKHHPDLQTAENKKNAEEIMKLLNEAYETLSNEEKRKQYNEKLIQEREKAKENFSNPVTKTEHVQQQNNLKQEPMTEKEWIEKQKQKAKEQQKMQQEMQKKVQEDYEQKYREAYYDYLRSLGYKIKYKWTWKNYKDFFIAIGIIITIGAVLWLFPPTHQMLVDFYESNGIVHTVVNVIGNIFIGIKNAIVNMFSSM